MKTNKFQIILLFSVFLLQIFSVNAQDVSEYETLLQTTDDPLIQLMALDSLISIEGKKNIEKFVDRNILFIETAKEIDSVEAATKKMIGLSYTLTAIVNEPTKTVRMIDELLARKYKIKNSYLLGNLYLKRGGANFRLNLEEAITDYDKAIESFTDQDSLYIADAHLFKGQAYSNLGKFVPAGESYKMAYEYFEALKDYEYMSYARQGITTMFSMNGFFDKAFEERKKTVKKLTELDLDHQLVTVYFNQAYDFKKLGDTKKQLEYLKKAEAIISKRADKIRNNQKAMVYAKLIEYNRRTFNQEEAKKYFDIILSNHDETSQDLLYKSYFLDAKVNYLLALNKEKEALPVAIEKLDISKKLGYEEDIMTSNKLLSEVYEALNDYKAALKHKKIYQTTKDSLYNKTVANSLVYYQTLYETEKKENELMAKNTNIQLLQKDNEVSKKRFLFISIALVLFFGMVLLYRNQMQIKTKKILQEKFSQELLVSQEDERKRISKDLHDGLGQQLLLIKNKLTQTKDTETHNMVENAIEEVRGISRNLHPFQLQELGITKAIEMTLDKVDENTTLFISSEIDNIDNIFDKKQEVNFYRIVQESLNNIIKHAKAEAGKITISKDPGAIIMEIKDNGIGFDFNEKFQSIRSLGLKTLLERTKFLNGQMKVVSKKNIGTTLEFRFPTI